MLKNKINTDKRHTHWMRYNFTLESLVSSPKGSSLGLGEGQRSQSPQAAKWS